MDKSKTFTDRRKIVRMGRFFRESIRDEFVTSCFHAGLSKGGTKMSLENHLQELSARHKKLDNALQEESKRPSSDSLKMSRMKREKLKLKEEIQSLQGDLNS